MNKQECEYLSALIDDECTDRHESTMLTLLKDANASSIFKRYHLIGDVMRSNLSQQVVDITQQIHEKIAIQDLPVAEPKKYSLYSMQVRGICAMAVSLIIAVVIFFSDYQSNQSVSIAQSIPSKSPANMLHNYLVSHNGYRTNIGFIGMSPNIRAVANDMNVSQ